MQADELSEMNARKRVPLTGLLDEVLAGDHGQVAQAHELVVVQVLNVVLRPQLVPFSTSKNITWRVTSDAPVRATLGKCVLGLRQCFTYGKWKVSSSSSLASSSCALLAEKRTRYNMAAQLSDDLAWGDLSENV